VQASGLLHASGVFWGTVEAGTIGAALVALVPATNRQNYSADAVSQPIIFTMDVLTSLPRDVAYKR
jgi:hypothetical protein